MDTINFDLDGYLKESKLDRFKKNAETWRIEESSKKLQYFTHGFFRYYGKFPPPVASRFLEEYHKKSDELVLDPMVGSGTTLVEASLRNVDAVGLDVNELSVMLSKVKTTYIPPKKIKDCIIEFEKFTSKKIGKIKQFVPDDKYLDHWFHNKNISELANIRKFIESRPIDPKISNLLRVGLASIIRNVSRASKAMGRMFLDPALEEVDTYQMYVKKISKYAEVMENWESKKKTQKVYLKNAKNIPLEDNSVGMTICHPPYYNLYKYSSIFKFEMLWSGFDYSGTKKNEIFEGFKIGKSELVPRYLNDMNEILNEICRVMKERRYCVLMMGDAVIKEKRLNTTSLLLENLKKFDVEKIIIRIPKYTEASYAASQRRGKQNVGVNIPDHLVILKKK
ncbi:MAG: DNA methyltransferase [Candidatus Nitrosopumilus sp. bin_32a]